jgi:transcriptional regulator with XRE-family HTH domain
MATPEEERGPGRPEGRPGTSMGGYLRKRRQEKGWTIRELARQVGLSDSAAGYLSQLETTDKSPHTDLAMRLTEVLGDPKGVFLLWSRIGRRSDPYEAALARRELSDILGDSSIVHDPRFSRPGTSRFERMQDEVRGLARVQRYSGASMEAEPGRSLIDLMARRQRSRLEPANYRVPIIPEGAEPRLGVIRARRRPETEFIRLEIAIYQERLFVPFAYRLTEASLHRVAAVLKPGDVAVFSQVTSGINEQEIYAIRVGDKIELAHAMWNGRELLLLPDAGKSDFLVLPANENELPDLVAGHMITVVRPEQAP